MVLNAMETLLVDEAVVTQFLPRIAELYAEKQVDYAAALQPKRFWAQVLKQQPKKIGTPNI